jgi:TRAP-type mannitol/chloroaromatic compound transport system permease small subunit
MSKATAIYLGIIRIIDGITLWVGYVVALLLAPLVVANTIEVFMRYVVGQPTAWALEVTIYTYGALFMLGTAFAMLKGAHVRTDIFWEKFSERTKGIIDATAYGLLLLPSMALLFYVSLDKLVYAWSIDERSIYTVWQPPLWPLRAVVPAAAALLFLQGTSELMKNLWAVRTGETLVQRRKIAT